MNILFLDRHPDLSGTPASIQSLAYDLGHSSLRDLSEHPDIVLVIDWHASFSATIRRAKRLGIPRILIMMEPTVVIPEYLRKNFRSLFTSVLEVGRPHSNPVFHWPQNWNTNYFDNEDRLERIVAISSNKYSFVPGEMYSLRANAYSIIETLDLFGHGWNRSFGSVGLKLAKELIISLVGSHRGTLSGARSALLPQNNFMGPSTSKWETISKYRYSLVIENSLEFMSEKLVDSILAGSMPVYVGPPTETFGIPKSLVFSAGPSIESVKLAYERAVDSDWDVWKGAARDWITDPSSQDTWGAQNSNTRLLEHINSCL